MLCKNWFKPKTSKFDDKGFEQIWPTYGAHITLTEVGKALLHKSVNLQKPDISDIDVERFIAKSLSFPIKFGRDTCRVMSQPKERYEEIKKQIASAYPIIHERVVGLYLAFLEHKCKYGGLV
uniref:UDP-N-acetylglucosamine 1-carboxyvinyltransferase n=1 Tax=Zeugodacus cucurbitae TaxID=28588 RepID=A0A0A1XIH7_ZEUCU